MDNTTVDQQIPSEVVAEVATTETPSEISWSETLPDHLKTNKNITKFKSVEDLATGYINSVKVIGGKLESLPVEEIKKYIEPADLVQAAQARGMPATIEEYSLPSLEEFPDKEIITGLKTVAMESGITPEQAEVLIKYNQEVQMKAQQAQKEAWISTLLDTYGDKTNEVMSRASAAAQTYMSPGLMKRLDAAGLGHDPDVIAALDKIAREMLPDQIPRGKAVNASQSEAVQEKINTLIKDPTFNARWRRNDPKAIAELNSLYSQL